MASSRRSAAVGPVEVVKQPAAAPEIEQTQGAGAGAGAVTTKGAMPKLPSLPRMRKSKEGKPCECGCGDMTRGGRFIPGHDSYLKGLALRIERGVIKYKDIEHEGQRKAVMRLMKAGGPSIMKRSAEQVAADNEPIE